MGLLFEPFGTVAEVTDSPCETRRDLLTGSLTRTGFKITNPNLRWLQDFGLCPLEVCLCRFVQRVPGRGKLGVFPDGKTQKCGTRRSESS
jgi:hypothetical protein